MNKVICTTYSCRNVYRIFFLLIDGLVSLSYSIFLIWHSISFLFAIIEQLHYSFHVYNSQEDLDEEDIEEINDTFVETKRTSDQKQQDQEYNKKKKKIFDNVVDYNDQLIVCENCLRPIIVWDVTTIIIIPGPKYCKACLKYAML